MTKVYEQVEQSGLYRLAGTMIHGRFVKATGQRPLKTLRQWQAVQHAPRPGQATRMTISAHCGEEYELVRDQSGQLMPCSNCGLGWKDAAMPSQPLRFESFDPPQVGARILALQANRAQGQVAEYAPVPVVSRPLAAPQRRETYAPRGDMGARILAEQVRLGQRDAPQSPLRTMDASVPCGRCGKRGCPCPPAAPDIAAACRAQRARDVQRQHEADLAAFPNYAAMTRQVQP